MVLYIQEYPINHILSILSDNWIIIRIFDTLIGNNKIVSEQFTFLAPLNNKHKWKRNLKKFLTPIQSWFKEKVCVDRSRID